jgi:hypothetical protein
MRRDAGPAFGCARSLPRSRPARRVTVRGPYGLQIQASEPVLGEGGCLRRPPFRRVDVSAVTAVRTFTATARLGSRGHWCSSPRSVVTTYTAINSLKASTRPHDAALVRVSYLRRRPPSPDYSSGGTVARWDWMKPATCADTGEVAHLPAPTVASEGARGPSDCAAGELLARLRPSQPSCECHFLVGAWSKASAVWSMDETPGDQ